jgi:hypothetical protein
MAGSLDLHWQSDGTLTVRGTGFAPHERLALTVTVMSGGSSVVTGGGTLMQSSGSSVQSSTGALQADARGAFEWKSTVIATGDADVTVTVRGDQGSSAEAHVHGSRQR